MGHKVFVTDVLVVKRELELPEHCPKCMKKFELGTKTIAALTMRPVVEDIRLMSVLDKGNVTEAFETQKVVPAQPGEFERAPLEFRCKHCRHVLVRSKKRFMSWADNDITQNRFVQTALHGLLRYTAKEIDDAEG